MAKRFHDDESKFFDYSTHIPSRTIYVSSNAYDETGEFSENGLDFSVSEKFIKGLILLESCNKEPITVIFNMIGGDWYHGIAMYDYMRSCKSHITMIGFGQVRSMGTVVMQAADMRILAPNTRFMIHDGQEGYNGKPKDVINYAKESKHTLETCYKIYYESLKNKHFKGVSKLSAIKQISKWCDTDTYFSAEQSVEMGFADKILETYEKN
jgi:ATP-dependent Clp protease protease subunit